MDDSIRAEYQRRLAAGDKAGALAYLRMLRTQTDDPAARDAFNQAIAEIEGGDSASTYGGSAGPFGDQPDQWAAEHAPRGLGGSTSQESKGAGAGSAAAETPSYGGSPSYPGTTAGVPEPSSPAAHGAESGHSPVGQIIGGGIAGAFGMGGQAGEFIGDRVEHAFENVTGRGHAPAHEETPTGAEPAGQGPQNPLEAIGDRVQHAFENVTGRGTPSQHPKGEKTAEEEPDGGSTTV